MKIFQPYDIVCVRLKIGRQIDLRTTDPNLLVEFGLDIRNRIFEVSIACGEDEAVVNALRSHLHNERGDSDVDSFLNLAIKLVRAVWACAVKLFQLVELNTNLGAARWSRLEPSVKCVL